MIEAFNELYPALIAMELFCCTVAAVGIACAADMFGYWDVDEEGDEE